LSLEDLRREYELAKCTYQNGRSMVLGALLKQRSE
jgi:hypothetical protein